MEPDKPDKPDKCKDMLLIDWLIRATSKQVSFHTSGNKMARAEWGKPATEVK